MLDTLREPAGQHDLGLEAQEDLCQWAMGERVNLKPYPIPLGWAPSESDFA